MPAHRAAGPVLAVAMLLFAGLIALGGFIDLFAEPRKPQQAAYSPPPGDSGVGLHRFAAFGLLAWPTPGATPVPPPTTEPPPVADTGEASPQLPAPAPVPASEGNPPVIIEYQDYGLADGVLAAINGARAAQGIGPLAANSQLAAAAQSYAQLLTQLDTLAHDLSGGLLPRVQASGYTGGFLGEALWEGWGQQYAADQVVNQWLNSPPHRDILLNATYTDAGVACYVRSTDGALNTRCVLDVGAP